MEKLTKCPICGSKNIKKKLEIPDHFLTKELFELWECRECTTKFTNPRPHKENLSKYYESSEYLSHTANKQGPLGKFYNVLRIINIHNKYKLLNQYTTKGKVLDIGCGTGEFLHYLDKKGWECQGIEPNEAARKYAKETYQLPIEDENILKKLPAKHFDLITLWHVLEHIPEINDRLLDINRILKDDGTIFLALPNPASWDAISYNSYWAGYDVPRHLYHFSQTAVHFLAQQNGWKIITTKPLKMDAYYVSLLSERYKSNNHPIPAAIKMGFISNHKARKTGNYSSLIYILKKNHNTVSMK